MILECVKCLARQGVRHSHSDVSKWRMLFLGTDDFSVGVLQAVDQWRKQHAIEQLDVVTCAENYAFKRKKAKAPISVYAEQNDLIQLDWTQTKAQRRLPQEYDVAISASFGDFIPAPIVDQFKHAINVHPSLLPRWRGAAPIVHTIFNQESHTGVSFIRISKHKFDVGKILHQDKIEVGHDVTNKQLTVQLCEQARGMVPYVLDNLENLLKNAKDQNEKHATQATKVSKYDGFIDLDVLPCAVVERLQRALPEKVSLAVNFNGVNVKLGRIVRVEQNTETIFHGSKQIADEEIGNVHYHKKEKTLFIRLKDGWIGVDNIQVGSKKFISAGGFYNGYMVNKADGSTIKTIFTTISDRNDIRTMRR